ncbi:BZ3500_MvSof-1268-A1-R1_Chr2-2g04836 [Microbotryum saponariae]|uniref:BZ3500_MvSof-1268-A1-R1_Chr2-2g04836 protein n=1 Tax=Microbotryum saponariae TaxID=289078 RepID=A0A2X0L185_9BASI|nr:BZ3500_MvSof-1268-A1-R1_Chr2-2g04836 [Microbotryum saponariae]SDA00284.1 BZ3501_MvSof-1269-A2-R1_Chr2-2g04510 [Microbotryum saponariae]
MADPTLSSPHHHPLREGACAGLESRSNPQAPRFDPRLPRHPDGRMYPLQGSTLGGKVQLPPSLRPDPDFQQLLEGSDSGIPTFRENARSYYNALSFTSLAAHFDQTRLGTLGPPEFRVFGRLYHRFGALLPAVNQRPAFAQTWLIEPTEATDTRLGTRRRRQSHTKFYVDQARIHVAYRQSLCRDRRTHNLPTSSTEMAMLICDSDTNTGDRGPQDRIPQGKMASTPTFLFAGSTKLGRQSPETESRSTMVSNWARYLPVFVRMKKTKRRTMRMKTAKKGTKRMVMVNDEGKGEGVEVDQLDVSQVETDRLDYIWLHQESLRFTTAQGITDAVADGLTPFQIGRSVILGSTFKNSPREFTQGYQDAMACVVKYGKPSLFITVTCNPEWPKIKAALGPNDQACNRPDLIARVLKAKSGNKQRAGCFGDEWRIMSLLYSVLFFNLCSNHTLFDSPAS